MYIVVEQCDSDWMNIMYDAIFGQRGQTSTGDTSEVSSLLKISPLPFPKTQNAAYDDDNKTQKMYTYIEFHIEAHDSKYGHN